MPSDEITLESAPEVPGLVFRHFRAPDDYQNMAEITRASAEVDGTERADTAEKLASFFAHLTNCDPYQDMIFAEVSPGDGEAPEVIGYSRGEWRQQGSEARWYIFYGRVTPAWRGKGIGRAMLGWTESRLRKVAATHPADLEKLFICFAQQGETSFAAMVEHAGYRPLRYLFEMLRPNLEDIPNYPLPEGLEVRPVLPEHYRLIWEADVEAFQDHWGFMTPDESEYQAWLADKIIFQPELWQIAWDCESNQIAGQVRTFIDHEQNQLYQRKRGWTEFISVRKPWRRRGLARALIVRSLQAQKAAGMRESALGVDSENISGALRVYKDCGFRVTKTTIVYSKPLGGVG